MRLLRCVPVALALGSAALGCSPPEPPVLTPKSVTVTKVTLTGVDLQLRVDAYNTNRVDLSARTVTGKLKVDGKYDLGAVAVSQAVALPAGAHTEITVPLATTWTDLSALAGLAASNRTIPYSFDGSVNVGGARLNVDLPFHAEGSITHEQIVQATLRSLPVIPGFPSLLK